MASSEIMTSQTSLASNVVFCPAHGSDMGGCEADNKTPTATAFANAQAAIMASNCALGAKIMAALGDTENVFLRKLIIPNCGLHRLFPFRRHRAEK